MLPPDPLRFFRALRERKAARAPRGAAAILRGRRASRDRARRQQAAGDAEELHVAFLPDGTFWMVYFLKTEFPKLILETFCEIISESALLWFATSLRL